MLATFATNRNLLISSSTNRLLAFIAGKWSSRAYRDDLHFMAFRAVHGVVDDFVWEVAFTCEVSKVGWLVAVEIGAEVAANMTLRTNEVSFRTFDKPDQIFESFYLVGIHAYLALFIFSWRFSRAHDLTADQAFLNKNIYTICKPLGKPLATLSLISIRDSISWKVHPTRVTKLCCFEFITIIVGVRSIL